MNKNTRNLLRLISILVFGLGLACAQDWVRIPALSGNEDWLMVIGYSLLLFISR